MARINTEFSQSIKKYGAFDISACYNCGNCTAICPLSTEENSFPRKMIRATILGLEEKIISSPDPWLCYYCGECSDTCPRDADPGALMMAIRRYQIRKFSIGRFADFFYKNFRSLFMWIILTLISIGGILLFSTKPNMNEIKPLSFISLDVLHTGGIVVFVFLLALVISQLYIMTKSLKFKVNEKTSFWDYIENSISVFFVEILGQKRFSKCEDKGRYVAHLMLVWGFAGLFIATILVMMMDFFMPSNESARIIPKLIGLISGIPALYGVVYFIVIRIKKEGKYGKYSHHTDWIFLILIFLAILSGYAMDIFRWNSLFTVYYLTFAFHLIVVFELIITFPFTKFAHLMYRPFAIFLSEIGKDKK